MAKKEIEKYYVNRAELMETYQKQNIAMKAKKSKLYNNLLMDCFVDSRKRYRAGVLQSALQALELCHTKDHLNLHLA